ncbi:MAG: hypothetical protein KJO85_08405 [Gammaproteobacteria bacterium]|nr:hypothetical protein [Gammaproteobacteria bacterium]NNE05966.1 hypothetical protein [Xanthomonadales bacterium]
MNHILSCLLVYTMFAIEPLEAHEDDRQEALCEETITVFQDVSMIGRKDRLASNITRKHDEMNARGWRFVDMEIYVENADLEGAFLTYSRTVRCGEKS